MTNKAENEMTEQSMNEDNKARLAALASRRPAPSGSRTRTAEAPGAATNARTGETTRPRRSRRRHAASGGRVLAVGLSASAALLLTATLAQAGRPAAVPTAPSAPAPVVVRVVLTNGPGTSTVAPAAPVVTAAPVAAKATATSRAS
jgi:hypothetical protein